MAEAEFVVRNALDEYFGVGPQSSNLYQQWSSKVNEMCLERWWFLPIYRLVPQSFSPSWRRLCHQGTQLWAVIWKVLLKRSTTLLSSVHNASFFFNFKFGLLLTTFYIRVQNCKHTVQSFYFCPFLLYGLVCLLDRICVLLHKLWSFNCQCIYLHRLNK